MQACCTERPQTLSGRTSLEEDPRSRNLQRQRSSDAGAGVRKAESPPGESALGWLIQSGLLLMGNKGSKKGNKAASAVKARGAEDSIPKGEAETRKQQAAAAAAAAAARSEPDRSREAGAAQDMAAAVAAPVVWAAEVPAAAPPGPAPCQERPAAGAPLHRAPSGSALSEALASAGSMDTSWLVCTESEVLDQALEDLTQLSKTLSGADFADADGDGGGLAGFSDDGGPEPALEQDADEGLAKAVAAADSEARDFLLWDVNWKEGVIGCGATASSDSPDPGTPVAVWNHRQWKVFSLSPNAFKQLGSEHGSAADIRAADQHAMGRARSAPLCGPRHGSPRTSLEAEFDRELDKVSAEDASWLSPCVSHAVSDQALSSSLERMQSLSAVNSRHRRSRSLGSSLRPPGDLPISPSGRLAETLVIPPTATDGAGAGGAEDPDRETPALPSGSASPAWSPVGPASSGSSSQMGGGAALDSAPELELKLMMALDQYEDQGDGDWLSSAETSPAPFHESAAGSAEVKRRDAWSFAHVDEPLVAADESHLMQPDEAGTQADAISAPRLVSASRLAQPSSLPRAPPRPNKEAHTVLEAQPYPLQLRPSRIPRPGKAA